MNRTILGTLVLTLAALAAGCAKTSCDKPAASSTANADADPGVDDDPDPCGLSCSSDADCVTPGPYCVKGQCREHPGPQENPS